MTDDLTELADIRDGFVSRPLTPEELAARDLLELEAADPGRPRTREEKQAKRERMLEAARVAPRLDPLLWAPPFAPTKPAPDPLYRAWRRDNRPYRSAFRGIVRGERERKILLAVGEANAKNKENS